MKTAELIALQRGQPSSSSSKSSGDAADILITCGENIKLETLSWIGRIQKKYGFTSIP